MAIETNPPEKQQPTQPPNNPEVTPPPVPERKLPDVQGGASDDRSLRAERPRDSGDEDQEEPEIPERKDEPEKRFPTDPSQNTNKHMRGHDEGNVEGP